MEIKSSNCPLNRSLPTEKTESPVVPLVLPVLRLETGVEVPALCLPEGLCTSSAKTRTFLAGEIEFVSGLCVTKATLRDSDTLEGLRFSVYYVYLIHFMLSYLKKIQACTEGSCPT